MSEVTKPIILDETGQQMVDALQAIAIAQSGNLGKTSWKSVKNLVNAKLAPKAFPEGTLFHVAHETGITVGIGESTGITAATITEDTFIEKTGHAGTAVYEFIFDGFVWKLGEAAVALSEYGIQVTGTAVEGDHVVVSEVAEDYPFLVAESTPDRLTLIMAYGINGSPFDGYEAFYKNEGESAMAAGKYYVEFTEAVADKVPAGGIVSFTLTQALPAGGQLTGFETYSDAAFSNWKVKSFASATATDPIETVSVTLEESVPGDAVKLGNIANAGDGTLNAKGRIGYGSNHWGESNIRQWLNSDKAAGNWFVPQHKWDRLAAAYVSRAGFKRHLDPEFLSVLSPVQNVSAYNTVFNVDGSTSGSYETKDLFFLPSMTELGYGKNNNISEGSVWPLFASMAQIDKRIFDITNHSVARYRWLRSAGPSYTYGPRNLNSTTGALSNSGYAYGGLCAAPACCIIRES